MDSQAKRRALAEAQRNAKDEYDAGFFQGYVDLKRRVALVHLEWDLSAFSRVESDFWDVEPSAAEDRAPTGEAEEIEAAAREEIRDTRNTEVVVIDDPPA